jgi:glycerol-3-phosphate dehydrogenase (NAD(P)+)
VGVELAKGLEIGEIIEKMVMVAEGVKTAPAVMALAQEHQISMPIAEDVYRVVTGASTAKRAFRGLLRVTAGAESEPG